MEVLKSEMMVVNDNRWHHVVSVLPSTTLGSMVLFMWNGQVIGKSTSSGSTVNTATSQDVRIGQDFTSRGFKGL
jgi:hypothetical protein